MSSRPLSSSPQFLVLSQVIFSTLPGLIFWSEVPAMLIAYGFDIGSVGVFFMLQRGLGLIGPFLGVWAARHIGAARAAVLAELAIAFLMFTAFFLVDDKVLGLGFLSVTLASIIASGVLVNCRVTWLKQIDGSRDSTVRTVKWIAALIQAGYGLGGAVLLLVGTSREHCRWLIMVNGVSSLFGAAFLGLSLWSAGRRADPGLSATAEISLGVGLKANIQVFRRAEINNLLISAVCVYAAFGGANVLVLKAGRSFFREVGGYPVALLVYGISFVLGGMAIRSAGKLPAAKSSRLFDATFIFLCLLVGVGALIPVNTQEILWSGWFGVLFVFYAILLVQFEGVIFEKAKRENVSQIFAVLGLCSGVVWAAGEVIYSQMPIPLEYLTRGIFVGIGYFHWRRYLHSVERPILANAKVYDA